MWRCGTFQVLKVPVESVGPQDGPASVVPQDKMDSPGPEGPLDQRAALGLVTVETQDPEAESEPGVFLELEARPDLLFQER